MNEEKTETKIEKRIGVRMEVEHHKMVAEAANIKGLTVSAFVRMAAIEKSREILGKTETGKIEAIK